MNKFTRDRAVLFPTPLIGIVECAIAPNQTGRIKYKASYWSAKLYKGDRPTATLTPGQRVDVVGREGITLLVQSLANCSQ